MKFCEGAGNLHCCCWLDPDDSKRARVVSKVREHVFIQFKYKLYTVVNLIKSSGTVMKEDDVVLLHDIVLAIFVHLALDSNLFLIPMFNPIVHLTNLSTDELGLKVRVYFARGLWRSRPFLHKPRADLHVACRVELGET